MAVEGTSNPDTFDSVEELLRSHLAVSIGGWRGALESALPTAAFAIAWLATSTLKTALLAALVVTGLALLVRLAQRQTLRFVLYAGVGIAVSAFFALRTGKAEDAFVPGMIWNAVVGSITLLSNLVGWPLVGFLVGAGDPATTAEDPFAWHRHAGVVRIARRLTWVLVGLWAVRLSVMVPLYAAGQVGALAAAKIALGWPAYLLALALIGYLLLTGHTPLTPDMAGESFARRPTGSAPPPSSPS